ncbi:hypothetical protein TNCV_4275411 [Trichonephila clavipes]|nr:hypothetical protein TNCV_4275411 [Trichonephila clavipes]
MQRFYHLKNSPHVFYGGKALNGFPVRWTLGLNNPREMIRLVQCQRKENEQLLASCGCQIYITNCKARVGKMKNLDSKGKFHVPPLTTYERGGRQVRLLPLPPEHTNDDKLSLRSRWDIVQKK